MALPGSPMTVRALIDVLLPAYLPCANFSGPCAGACEWKSERGRVPCAFGGANGALEDVRLIIVTAEPGDPPDQAGYRGTPEDMVQNSLTIFERAMREGGVERRGRPTPFHRNMCRILDCFWPEFDLDGQLRRTWTTNAVLCRAGTTGGAHRKEVEAACAKAYLAPQLALLPHAFRLVLGDKARDRMHRAGLPMDAVGRHPSSRVSNEDKIASWRAAAERFRDGEWRT